MITSVHSKRPGQIRWNLTLLFMSLATGITPELCATMGFCHNCPDGLRDCLHARLTQNSALKIGALRQSAGAVPILTKRQ